MDILKATGEVQPFSREKLCASMQHAGAPAPVVQKVCGLVEQDLRPNTTTEQIERKTAQLLSREDLLAGARYRLRSAIMELGPSGFFFEDYIAAIFQEYGYVTKVGRMIRGHCLAYEIDIAATKDGTQHFMELKYHNRRGLKTDVQVVMYTYARFLDITAKRKRSEKSEDRAWVVTNTKFTKSAITYAKCMGVELLGWDYPKKKNLENMIQEKTLYPITVLPSATSFVKERFAQSNLMFVRDVLAFSAEELTRRFGIAPRIARRLLQDSYNLV